MQKSLPDFFPNLPRLTQLTPSYCGPAVLAMLLGNHGVEANQVELAIAAGVQKNIDEKGTNAAELALAVRRMYPNFQFWMKDNATIQELRDLVINYEVPVGVEWQGIFYEDADDDDGHYSVVVNIDDWDSSIWIADPYKKFAGRDRRLRLDGFEERWWDYNDIFNPQTNRKSTVKDYHLMFVVTRRDETFPMRLKMVRG